MATPSFPMRLAFTQAQNKTPATNQNFLVHGGSLYGAVQITAVLTLSTIGMPRGG